MVLAAGVPPSTPAPRLCAASGAQMVGLPPQKAPRQPGKTQKTMNEGKNNMVEPLLEADGNPTVHTKFDMHSRALMAC